MNKMIAFLFLCWPFLLFPQEVIIGDVDRSGKLDSSDLILITNHLKGKSDNIEDLESFKKITPETVDAIFQVQDDSLVNLLSTFGSFYRVLDPPFSLRYFQKAAKTAESLYPSYDYDNQIKLIEPYINVIDLYNEHLNEDAKSYIDKGKRIIKIDSIKIEKILLVRFYTQEAIYYRNKGLFKKAVNISKKAFRLCQDADLKGEVRANTLKNLGICYLKDKDWEKAEKRLDQAYKMFNKLHGDGYFVLAEIDNKKGNIYLEKEENSDALEMFLDAKDLLESKKQRGVEMADVYKSLGAYFGKEGNLISATNNYEDAIKLLEDIYGPGNALLIDPYLKLSIIYRKKSDFKKALHYTHSAERISKNQLNPNHILSSSCYVENANIFFLQEKYEKALQWYLGSLKILENLYGKDSKETAVIYSNITGVYRALDRDADALVAFTKAEKYYEAKDHFLGFYHHAVLLKSINDELYNLDEINKDSLVRVLLKKAEIIVEEYPNKHVVHQYRLYKELAKNYMVSGENKDALKYAIKSKILLERLSSVDYENKVYIYNLISEIYISLENFSKAEKELKKCLKWHHKVSQETYKANTYKLLARIYVELNEIDQAIDHYKMSFDLEDKVTDDDLSNYLNLLLESKKREHYKDVVEYRIRRKNSELEEMKTENIKENREENLLKRKKVLQRKLQQIQQEGTDLFQMEELEKQIKEIKVALRSLAKEDPKEGPLFESIREFLPFDESIVDIMKYTDSANIERYIAWIIKQSTKYPILVDIGPADKLENKWFEEYIDLAQSTTKDKSSYNRYWMKISEQLNDIETVHFCADGIYHRINPSILYNTDTKEYVLQEKKIVLISSLKDISAVKDFSIPSTDTIFLIGNPKFTLTKEDGVIEQLNAKIESVNTQISWHPLTGTEKEIIAIEKMLKDNKGIVKKYIGKAANETNLKSITSPKYLHIATHGFFNKQESEHTSGGLVFSGANNTNKQERVKNYGDGYLYNIEVGEIDLSGTELVVLSACETANGVIDNEGIKGLQSAFKIAGAEHLIMSHWSVHDDYTQRFMRKLYQHILSGKKLSDSFIRTQKEIAEELIFPKFWGAFILIKN